MWAGCEHWKEGETNGRGKGRRVAKRARAGACRMPQPQRPCTSLNVLSTSKTTGRRRLSGEVGESPAEPWRQASVAHSAPSHAEICPSPQLCQQREAEFNRVHARRLAMGCDCSEISHRGFRHMRCLHVLRPLTATDDCDSRKEHGRQEQGSRFHGYRQPALGARLFLLELHGTVDFSLCTNSLPTVVRSCVYG